MQFSVLPLCVSPRSCGVAPRTVACGRAHAPPHRSLGRPPAVLVLNSRPEPAASVCRRCDSDRAGPPGIATVLLSGTLTRPERLRNGNAQTHRVRKDRKSVACLIPAVSPALVAGSWARDFGECGLTSAHGLSSLGRSPVFSGRSLAWADVVGLCVVMPAW